MNWENFKRDLPLLIKHASGAFCSAPIAGRASLSLMSSAISQTKLNSWESILLRRNPVRFLVTSDLSGCCNARPKKSNVLTELPGWSITPKGTKMLLSIVTWSLNAICRASTCVCSLSGKLFFGSLTSCLFEGSLLRARNVIYREYQ